MDTFWSHHERTRGSRPALLAAAACALALHSTTRIQPAAAQATIGLYTDVSGSTCSISGNDPGFFKAYVVLRPTGGINAVQFAAPIPACLGATFVNDVVPPGMLALGSSQTGMSISLGGCYGVPISVLEINYLRSGSTDPCCEYSIVADPELGHLSASNCAYQEVPLVGVTSYFNADASCQCIGNSAPDVPSSESPYDGELGVGVRAVLDWEGTDRDNNLAEFDLYLGTAPSPPLVAPGLTSSDYAPPSALEPFTRHYWRVVARDELGLETSGPTWTFTTRGANTPPNPPANFSPADGAHNVLLDAVLHWVGTDIDLDPLVYDVYFGTSSPPPLVRTDVVETTYAPASMTINTVYYWKVVARDIHGAEMSSAVWSFETRPENLPPNVPRLLVPADGAQGQPINATLIWTATDVDPDTLVSDVYLGTSPTPPLVASGLNGTVFITPSLLFSTQYYWRVVVRDHRGLESSSLTWTFATRPENWPPDVPSHPFPPDDARDQPVELTLTWQCNDRDDHTLTYDVYFGLVGYPPPLVASNVAVASYTLPVLRYGDSPSWSIVARDELGAETSGPVWGFDVTESRPPEVPSNPYPRDKSTHCPINQTLQWYCQDHNFDPLKFDVYFGTTNPPPLVVSNTAHFTFEPGILAFSTEYRWRIVARDPGGLERQGPLWSFTTKANSPPNLPGNPIPSNHGLSSETPVLTWTSRDEDPQALTYSVHFGTTSPPPLVATGLTVARYEPGTLVLGGEYFWQIVIDDGLVSTSGPTWDFRVAEMGDANGDGVVDLADPACALGNFLRAGPCAFTQIPPADVDCSGLVSPRDARCIHLHVLDDRCDFCPGASLVEPAVAANPVVMVTSQWEVDDTMHVRLSVSGVPSLQAFGFLCQSEAEYAKAKPIGATVGFDEFGHSPYPGSLVVGGYALTGVPANSPVEFVELSFFARSWFDGWIHATYFVDDFAGVEPFIIYLGGNLPVLISQFEAVRVDRGIHISWELQADEAMESFTLYRRTDGAVLPVVIAQGPVQSTHSYLDESVEPGRTYHYELLIQTVDGDEFRSPIATVTTQTLGLVLGQNHPNPFNPQTVIPYELPASARPERVRLWILDTTGRVVSALVDESQSAGSYRVVWEGKDARGESVSSGVYFYVLDVGGERRTRKLVLLK